MVREENKPNVCSNATVFFLFFFFSYCLGAARTRTPGTINSAPEFPTFGEIASFSPQLSAMSGPLPEGSAFLITASPAPGKYEVSLKKALFLYIPLFPVLVGQKLFYWRKKTTKRKRTKKKNMESLQRIKSVSFAYLVRPSPH